MKVRKVGKHGVLSMSSLVRKWHWIEGPLAATDTSTSVLSSQCLKITSFLLPQAMDLQYQT
jgi:hypothetical protein